MCRICALYQGFCMRSVTWAVLYTARILQTKLGPKIILDENQDPLWFVWASSTSHQVYAMNIAPDGFILKGSNQEKYVLGTLPFINYFVTSYNRLEKMRKPAISWNMHVSAERAHLSPAAQYGILYIWLSHTFSKQARLNLRSLNFMYFYQTFSGFLVCSHLQMCRTSWTLG